MPDANQLASYYQSLTDSELLNQVSEGGFTDEAERVLKKELTRRHLNQSDVKRYVAATQRSSLHDEVAERGEGYRSLGVQFFGRSYLSEADKTAEIQVRTKWLTVSGIPLIPIASYRFRCTSGNSKRRPMDASRSVVDRMPLQWGQVFLTGMKTTALLIGGVVLIVGAYWLLERVKR
jgi:hypothetical protein